MNIEEIVVSATTAIKKTKDIRELELLRVKYLGREGELTKVLRSIGSLPPKERGGLGQSANQAKQELESLITAADDRLRAEQIAGLSSKQGIDLSKPTSAPQMGHDHPISQLIDEVVRIFWQLGFQVADGPEVETEWYNFEALNIPADHPARDLQDTFYLEGGNLPRTHTSGVQVRYMEQHQPPIRIVAPGKVYRNEDEDNRHIWSFHQLEGLVIDEGIGIGDLKGTLLALMQGLFGSNVKIRLRPNYFPYTEPSIEIDASCVICGGKGCATCSQTGWLELLGSGMVHPMVLRNAGIDPTKYSGFAFGVGFERLASIRYGTPDLREFWRPNLKFLEQF